MSSILLAADCRFAIGLKEEVCIVPRSGIHEGGAEKRRRPVLAQFVGQVDELVGHFMEIGFLQFWSPAKESDSGQRHVQKADGL